MPRRKSLEERYSGAGADAYDTIRRSSARWSNEEAAFAEVLKIVRPLTAVDVPFGTGRWIVEYEAQGTVVTGLDVSPDMLAKARRKTTNPDRFRFVEASIFDFDFPSLGPIDLAVCVRLVNWFDYDRAVAAVRNLSNVNAKFLLLGCSVVPEGVSTIRRLRMKARLLLTNLRTRREPPQHVHDEKRLLGDLAALGWKEARRFPIFENPSRGNFFYLLNR